ncbi:ICP22 family protein [Mycolicibacterium baixiangningiae]|uniref:hypothetical protein n=1 Tax=Mycolicibacterium baixiangningiae TaxID=2761578 RepID=UPI001E306048|nr:hypothetical protein [Mycolicibacterium baixiangningiae]
MHISHAADAPANSAPRRVRRRRGSLRPAITGGLAVLGATALVGTFVTPAPAEARTTAYAVSAPTPTPLLAALALPFDAVELEAAARAAIDLDFDAVFRFNSDLVDLMARLGASLRLDVDVDLDAEAITAAFADLINALAFDVNGAITAANGAFDLGAALVVEIATAAALAGADGVDAIAGALVSLLAALTPEGGVAADLSAAIGLAIGDIGDLIGTGIVGAGAAVAWKATLDDLLVDLVATGGIALTNGVAGSLVALLGGTADLPDIGGEDVVLALGNLVELFADGINGGLLTAGGAVELGVSVIADLARALAEAGVGVRADITGALLGVLGAPEALVELVGDISVGIDGGIRGVGEAIAWKFTLDDVLVDVGVAGGVSLVNGLTAALFGGAGLPVPDLPDVDFAASVRALVNHFAVALGIDLDLEVDAGVGIEEEIEGEGDADIFSAGADTQRTGVTNEETDSEGDLTPIGELDPSEDGDDDQLPGNDTTGDSGDQDLGDEDLDEVEQLPEDDGTGDVVDETGDEADEADEAEDTDDTGDAGDPGADTGGDTGETGGDTATE